MTKTILNDAGTINPPSREHGQVNQGMVLGEILDDKNIGQTNVSVPVSLRTPTAPSSKGDSWWKARDTLVLLSFLGMTLNFTVRVSLSIAIVAMVNRTETSNASLESDTCPVPDDNPANTAVVGEFEWSDKTVAMILGAFSFGTGMTNFLGGRAAENFGAGLIFGISVFIPSILSLLSPLSAYVSEYLLFALRVIQGMAQGAAMPALHLLLAAWIPPKDKAKYASIIFAGIQAGNVIGMAFGGWLCNTTFLGGWPSVFYVFGALGVLWGIPWFFLIHSLPEHHPRISTSELEYIQTHRRYVKRDKAVAIPWRDIATSLPFWAIVAANFSGAYTFFTLLTELPTFFHVILHFDMNKNALGSSLPYICQFFIGLGWGFFVDLLLRRNYITVIGVRKLSTAVANYMSAACLVAIMWVNCNAVLAIVLMCLAVGLRGPMGSGSLVSEQDIAPNLAGSLKGLTSTIGSIAGVLAPAVTAAITSGNQTVSGWNTVFLIAAAFNLLLTTVFMFFGTDQVQPWNDPKPER